MATMSQRYRVIGTRPIRHDGIDKVTGRAKYGGDVHMPDLLESAMLRSPYAHARIKAIDTSKAVTFSGVKAIITGADMPHAQGNANYEEVNADPVMISENCMARSKVLYKGHAVAAVAAVDKHTAEIAAGLIAVDYEPLPAVLDVRESMKDSAPILHDDQSMMTRGFSAGAGRPDKPSNIGSYVKISRGDLAQGFLEADLIVEREFTTQAVHQGYIEPHNSTAWWAPDGTLTIWKSTQGPFIVRSQLACILNIPVSKVTVIPMEIGGGFGGKISTYLDPITALLSRECGHPVKMVMTRSEVFEATGPTSGTYMRAKIGAKRNGLITALEGYFVFEAGAYPGSAVGAALVCSPAPYNVPNVCVEGYDVVVNKPKVAPYRAPGTPQGALSLETVIDELAQKLDMDPVTFRMQNAPNEGDRQITGIPFGPIGCTTVEEAIKIHPHYTAPLGPNQGRGVAMGYWGNAGKASSATLNVNSDGTISLITGSVDIGGSRAALAMQAAEVLGLTVNDVHPNVADTDSVGWTSLTGGSRTAFSTGLAVIKAAQDIQAQMAERAAKLWETETDDVVIEDGVFISKRDPEDKLTLKELAAKLLSTGGPITASASVDPKAVSPSFSGIIVDVEVDPETGKVDVMRCTTFQDTGTAAHPSYVEGQMQGGTAQGIGWALNEEYCYKDDGVMLNPTFLDYRMPTSLDLPMIDTQMIELPNKAHPYGVKGVGEIPIVPPMAAVANAVSRAINIRIGNLPITPRAVLEALGKC